MRFGTLDFVAVDQRPELVAVPTGQAVLRHDLQNVLVAQIDTSLADPCCEQGFVCSYGRCHLAYKHGVRWH